MDEYEHLRELTESRVEYCSVCGDTADGYHYGVLSCRGCNAFFRRAVTYNLQFQCRRGGTCVIDRNARCSCRACRLDKCKLAGMDRSAVQIRRDLRDCKDYGVGPAFDTSSPSNDRKLSSEGYGLKCGLNESVVDQSPCSTSMKSSPHSNSDYIIGSPQSAFTPLVSTTSGLLSPTPPHPITVPGSSTILSSMGTCSSFPSSSSPASYLNKMVEEYFDQRKRRRSMLCTTLEELLTDDCETRLRSPAVLDDFSAIYKIQMILMFEWAEKLEEFQHIDPHDKARLLRTFSMNYLLLDNIFHTLELNYDDRLVLVNNSFVQPGNVPSFTNLKTIQEHRALALVYGEKSVKIIEELIRPLVDMNVTFGEILLLRLIIFWNPGPIGLAPETCKTIARGSERALRELHVYFDDNKVPELKSRLSNLLLLLAPLAVQAKHLTELTSFIPDFGTMPEWDSFMNDLLR